MVQLDHGIMYEGTKKEIKATIARLKELGLNTKSIEEKVNAIDATVKKEVQSAYTSFSGAVAYDYLPDSVLNIYKKYEAVLDNENNILKKDWALYYKIHCECKEIDKLLETVDESSIELLVDRVLNVLCDIKKSSNINYDTEESMVNRVYDLVYQAIQMELIYSNGNKLLQRINSDPTDVSYIAEFCEKDLKNVEDHELQRLYSEFKAKRMMNSNYNRNYNTSVLDKRLLVLLALYKNPNITSANAQKFIDEAKEIEKIRKKQAEALSDKNAANAKLEEIHKKRKSINKDSKRQRIVAFIQAVIVALGVSAGAVIDYFISTEPSYETTTTLYDSSTDETTLAVDYQTGKDEDLIIVEYTPWEEPGVFREGYKRNEYVYRVDSSEFDQYENLEDYLNPDTTIADSTSDIYETTEKPLDFGYTESKYVVLKKDKDFTKKERTFSTIARRILGNTLGVVIMGLSIVFNVEYWKRKYRDQFRLTKRQRKENNLDLMEGRHDLRIASNEIVTQKEREGILKRQMLTEYENLPASAKENEEVKRAYKKTFNK